MDINIIKLEKLIAHAKMNLNIPDNIQINKLKLFSDILITKNDKKDFENKFNICRIERYSNEDYNKFCSKNNINNYNVFENDIFKIIIEKEFEIVDVKNYKMKLNQNNYGMIEILKNIRYNKCHISEIIPNAAIFYDSDISEDEIEYLQNTFNILKIEIYNLENYEKYIQNDFIDNCVIHKGNGIIVYLGKYNKITDERIMFEKFKRDLRKYLDDNNLESSEKYPLRLHCENLDHRIAGKYYGEIYDEFYVEFFPTIKTPLKFLNHSIYEEIFI